MFFLVLMVPSCPNAKQYSFTSTTLVNLIFDSKTEPFTIVAFWPQGTLKKNQVKELQTSCINSHYRVRTDSFVPMCGSSVTLITEFCPVTMKMTVKLSRRIEKSDCVSLAARLAPSWVSLKKILFHRKSFWFQPPNSNFHSDILPYALWSGTSALADTVCEHLCTLIMEWCAGAYCLALICELIHIDSGLTLSLVTQPGANWGFQLPPLDRRLRSNSLYRDSVKFKFQWLIFVPFYWTRQKKVPRH